MHVVLIKSDPKAREKPCLRCGYSLRKILDSKYCPECGLSVWLSLNPNDALDWSNPAWLRRLSLASWAMAAAQVVGIGAFVLGYLERYRFLQQIMARPTSMPITLPWSFYVRFSLRGPIPRLVSGMYLMAYNAGLLLLASDEGRYPDKWINYRWACRLTAGLGLLIGVMQTVWPGEFSFKLAVVASTLSTFAYLRKLAQRIPHSLLVRICAIVLLAPALSLLKTLPVFFLFAMSELFNLLELLPLVYLPATAVLLVWFGVVFHKSAGAASEGWLKESAPAETPSPV